MSLEYTPNRLQRWMALTPFAVFIIFYVGLSVWAQDFYKVPMPVAFLVASATALFTNRREPLKFKIERYAKGMGETDIMIMCLVFILAGSFAATCRQMGAVEAAVSLALNIIPAKLILAGLFIVSCFISLAIGTSVGTIATLVPIALGLTDTMAISPAICVGAVVGGAMFGDNMSIISDTTIAATRTQNVELNEKFYANIIIAIPAAIICSIIYICMNNSTVVSDVAPMQYHDVIAITPYILVLVLAIRGFNVMGLLFFGTIIAGTIGMVDGSFDLWGFLDTVGKGALSMADTLIVALLAGGLLSIIRHNGGLDVIMESIARHIKTRHGAELGIAFLVALVNIFTANNTVAIVIAGPMVRNIAYNFKIAPRQAASILDSASCVAQGLIPYGAQVLTAATLAGGLTSSFEIIKTLYYPIILAVTMALIIIFRPKGKTSA